MINPLLKSLIAEFGITFAYYIVSKYSKRLINKLDKPLIGTLEGIVKNGDEFQYYCQKCKGTMELFEDGDSEHIQFKEKCKHCKSNKIHLKIK